MDVLSLLCNSKTQITPFYRGAILKIISWLERKNLFQTIEPIDIAKAEQEITEIRALFDEERFDRKSN